MNRKLKKEIAAAFDAPEPLKKTDFVRTLPHPRIRTSTFIMSQIPFIAKSLWLLSALILLPAVWGAYSANGNTVWVVSGFIPFLALLLITESAKSTTYGMNELEMAARFSLKSVVLARLSILAIFNFLLFCLLIPLCHAADNLSLLQTGLYLFVPYLLTSTICLYLVRHFRDKEVIYGCMAAAAFVSGTNMTLRFMAGFLFQTGYLTWWILAVFLLSGLSARETYKTIRKTEGVIWNFTLTD